MNPEYKQILSTACYWSGADALLRFLNRKRKKVLTFHNVLPDAMMARYPQNSVCESESHFRSIIRLLKKRYRFSTDINDPSTLTITFDDGYCNEGEVAGRVLKEEGDIPAIVFASGKALDSTGMETALCIDRLLYWCDYAPEKAIERLRDEVEVDNGVRDSRLCGALGDRALPCESGGVIDAALPKTDNSNVNLNLQPQPSPNLNLQPQPSLNLNLHPQPSLNLNLHPQPSLNLNLHSQPSLNLNLHPQPSLNLNLHPQPSLSRHSFWLKVMRPAFCSDAAGRGENFFARCNAIYPFAKIVSQFDEEYRWLRFSGISENCIADLRSRGWIIGWHTKSHFQLSELSADAVRDELTPREDMRGLPMSYPYGHEGQVGAEAVRIAEELGYPIAYSDQMDPSALSGRWFMPRIEQFEPNEAALEFEVSGMKYWLKNGKLLEKVEVGG